MSTRGKAGTPSIQELDHQSRRRAKSMALEVQKTIQGKVRVPCKTRPNTQIYIDRDKVSDYMADYKKPMSDLLKKYHSLS